MTSHSFVSTGRTDSRRQCASCEMRVRYGDPKPNDTWATRLRLTQESINLLLVAAAEYRDLSGEMDDPESAVSFVDWITLTALGRETGVRPDHDGGVGGTREDRHPFPLPLAELPGKARRVAS